MKLQEGDLVQISLKELKKHNYGSMCREYIEDATNNVVFRFSKELPGNIENKNFPIGCIIIIKKRKTTSRNIKDFWCLSNSTMRYLRGYNMEEVQYLLDFEGVA